MNKKKWIRIVSIYSIIYAVITLLNSVLYLRNGIYEDPSGNWHELDRAMILLIGIAAFELCTNLPVKALALVIFDCIYSLSAVGVRLCLVLRTAGTFGENSVQDIWINFLRAFCVVMHHQYCLLCF